jgi:hypothetical protein
LTASTGAHWIPAAAKQAEHAWPAFIWESRLVGSSTNLSIVQLSLAVADISKFLDQTNSNASA